MKACRLTAVGVLISLCHLFLFQTAQTQTRVPHSRFIINQWEVKDGLPVNNVMKMHQSAEGYIWMATLDGLVRFDGLQFKIYHTINYPELPSNRFVRLYEGADGSLWIVSEQRYLTRFKKNQFTHIQHHHGLNGDFVYDVHLDDSGHLWFGTDRGISFFDGEELQPFQQKMIQGTIDRVFVDPAGAVWFRKLETLENFRFDRGQSAHLFTSSNSFHFNPVAEEADSTLWFSSLDEIYRFKDDSLQYCCSKNEFLENIETAGISLQSYSAQSFDQGNFSFINNIGRRFTPGTGETSALLDVPFQVTNFGQPWEFTRNIVKNSGETVLDLESRITSTLFDREGNLWVATSAEGLFYIKPNPFQTWSREEGLPGRNIYPVFEDDKNSIWVGTYGEGVARIVNNRVESIAGSEGTVLSFFQKSDGTLFAGYYNGGYYAFNPETARFVRQNEPEDAYSSDIYAIFEQTNGDFWLGTSTGLFVRQNTEWKNLSRLSGLGGTVVRFFQEAPDGSLWMATNGAGLARYKNGQFETYSTEDGFGSNLIRSLFIEPDSDPDNYVMWVGSEDQGLFRLDVEKGEPKITSITQYDPSVGLLDYMIHIILMDDAGHFWMNTNRGIFSVPKDELERFHIGEIPRIKGEAFTEADGIRNREGNGGIQPAGVFSSDGSIWLPGQDGVKSFYPDSIVTNNVVPPVIIEEIRTTDYDSSLVSVSAMSLNPTQRDFEIHFSALSFAEPTKNNFRYRLKGFNDEWINAGNRRMAAYTNIPAGSYTFEVMGSNNAGVWNPETAALEISVAPFFYETRWFLFLVLFSLAALIYGGIRIRVRRLEQAEETLKKLVEEKTMQLQKEKEITELQARELKELDRAKTRFFTNISHELRTPLTLIIGPLQRALSNSDQNDMLLDKNELSRMLRNGKRLTRLMDQTLELSKIEYGKQKLSVREIELNHFLEDLTSLFSPLFEENEISFVFKGLKGEKMVFADPYKLDNIIGNLLSNAVKFTSIGGTITVETREDSRCYHIRVSDDGIGISEENQQKIFDRFYQVSSSETRTYEGSGIGLSLAREFAKQHHGKLEVQSEPGKGSTFILTLRKGSAHFQKEELQPVDEPFSQVSDDRNYFSNGSHIKIDSSSAEDQTTLLIVEDNGDLRSFIREVFESKYRVLEAENGSEALKIVTEQLPDLIIADIMMPGMDGISFNRKLKESDDTASVPLIFLTAKSSGEDQLEGLHEGADDYITKPFDPPLLQARVSNLIASRLRLRRLMKMSPQTISKTQPTLSYILPDEPFPNKIRAILEDQFSNPEFQVNHLSDELNLSRSYMVRKIRKETGLTPGELIKSYRMEKASMLLKEKSGNISEVAYAVGFKSLAYFSHTFKEYFDKTPSDFLREHTGE